MVVLLSGQIKNIGDFLITERGRLLFKEFVDECHSRGIAVILDVVYNHATGQSPLYRMYNNCDGCTGGIVATDSPYFNVSATHTYSVFNDFNHQSQATKDYVNKTAEYWIEEFHIDGYRWDLTKGFTQNCTSGNETCTNGYQQDRVDVLREYVDYSWSLDPYHYAIFEHLGSENEEKEKMGQAKSVFIKNITDFIPTRFRNKR